MTPGFFDRFDKPLTRKNLEKIMLIWWVKYLSAQIGFISALH
jgi:hypothetical protein